MTRPLRRVLVGTPAATGWDDGARRERWAELGYRHDPGPAAARAEHDALRRVLREAGAEVVELPAHPDLSLDAVYAHDPSLVTDHGAIILRMGKMTRRHESQRHAAFYREAEIPILGSLQSPATAEGGDLVWLDETTLLAGLGYRTNADGIAQLRAILRPHGVQVIEAPLPHGEGPDACLHLMSLMSLLGDGKAVVDLPWLAVPTVELLRGRGLGLIEMAPGERDTMASNVLALGGGRLLALAENPRTNDRLRQEGFQVIQLPGGEIAHNGRGGPTCLTRPLLRA